MSKSFLISMILVVVWVISMYLFPEFYSKVIRFYMHNTYVLIIVMDLGFLGIYIASKYNLKIQQNIFLSFFYS